MRGITRNYSETGRRAVEEDNERNYSETGRRAVEEDNERNYSELLGNWSKNRRRR